MLSGNPVRFREIDIDPTRFGARALDADARLVTAGGRVVNICATGNDLPHALERAYDAAALVRWPHQYMRHDIGRRVVEQVRQPD